MDLMARRRLLMSMLEGDDLKKKVFTGVTCAANELELAHNLGVIPKLIVIEDDNHQDSLEGYGMGEIFYAVLAPVETITFQNRSNGVVTCKNRASGNQSSTVVLQMASNPGLAQYTVSLTSLLVWNPISNADWAVAPSYTVTLYY